MTDELENKYIRRSSVKPTQKQNVNKLPLFNILLKQINYNIDEKMPFNYK